MPRLADLCAAIVDCEHKTAPTEAVGIPLIRTSDIRGGRLDLAGARRVSPDTYREWTRRGEPHAGDLILAREAPVGEIGLVPEGQRVCLGQRTVLVRPDADFVDARFLLYRLLAPDAQHLMRSKAEGSTNPHLNVSDIRDLALPELPSLEAQQAIGEALGALDDKIELNRQMNETLEAIAATLFDHLPKDSSVTVADIVALSRASIVPQVFPEEWFEHYSIPAFDQGSTPALDLGSEIRSSKLLVGSDAVLLSKLNPRIPRVWLPDVSNERRSICSTEFLVAVPRASFARECVYCLMRSQRFQDVLAGLVTGTSGSHQRVKPSDVLAIGVMLPTSAALESFTASVRPILSKVALNRRESSTLAALRDTLLPKLISGEIRVREAVDAVEAAT